MTGEKSFPTRMTENKDDQPEEGSFYDTNHLLSLPDPDVFERAKLIPKGTPLTFGATPLGYIRMIDQQRDVLDVLRERVYRQVPGEISPDIATFVQNTFESRFNSRGMANHDNYESSLVKRDLYSDNPFIVEMIDRAEEGVASPVELLVVRSLLGIRSVELACLTHPYGKNIEDLEIMRDVTRDSVELLGGTYHENPETRFRVKGVVREGETSSGNGSGRIVGVLMTRKRTLGTLPRGTTIRERTSFVLRLDDPRVVSEEQLESIRGIDVGYGDWTDEILKAGNLSEVATKLMEDDIYSLAVPISSTIYAFNLGTAEKIAAKQAEQKEAIRKESQRELENYPAIQKAMLMAARRAVDD